MYSDKIYELFNEQLNEWELARINYSQLENVKTRKLDFGDFTVLVQFNPERMRSSAAKVDAKSIGARPCFLCSENRPEVQRGTKFEDLFTILVNPFPIFRRHLTIPSDNHTEQRIRPNFRAMLLLANELPDFVIFYNGPECGASAPDHFHFQAGNRQFMPVEKDFSSGIFTRLLFSETGVEIYSWTRYMRGIITLKGRDSNKLAEVFDTFFEKFSDIQPGKSEPMLNILAYYDPDGWTVHIIPRKLHRPSQFFANGSDQILLSPASVDLGGVIITPREEDFLKIRTDDIRDIFRQVCMNESELLEILNRII